MLTAKGNQEEQHETTRKNFRARISAFITEPEKKERGKREKKERRKRKYDKGLDAVKCGPSQRTQVQSSEAM